MPTEKKVRDPEFARRLQQACDSNFHCPAPNFGRLGWIGEQMGVRFKDPVSIESVRKWLAGEVKPRGVRAENLARLLDVDPVWLAMGVDQQMTPREQKVRNAEADGMVNIVAGFIQADGGHPAFPEQGDKRAAAGHIDLYAIIRGASYAFHIATGRRVDDAWVFGVPLGEGAVRLGIVREGFNVRIFEITDELRAEFGERSGGSVAVTLTSEQIDAVKLESFANRL